MALERNSVVETPVPEPGDVVLSGMNNSGPAAIIIGASSGIGEALAREMHKRGWRLGLLARRLDRLNELAAGLGPGVMAGHLDVSAPDCVDGFNAMADRLGGADLVIISARVRTPESGAWSRPG